MKNTNQLPSYYIGFSIILTLLIPSVRQLLESTLTLHMLVQIPTLILAGWFIGSNMNISSQGWNQGGIPGLLVAITFLLFWFIPRWLDSALSDPIWEALKFISVPLLIGLPLGMSWSHASSFTRAVIWANGISMLLIMGWLYISSPIRICNNYLINQQEEFGYAAIALALAIACFWSGLLFFADWKKSLNSAKPTYMHSPHEETI